MLFKTLFKIGCVTNVIRIVRTLEDVNEVHKIVWFDLSLRSSLTTIRRAHNSTIACDSKGGAMSKRPGSECCRGVRRMAPVS